MKKLGKALHVSKTTGNLIVKAEAPAEIGADVFTSKMRRVGTVFDVFGPTSGPYVAVKPAVGDVESLVGRTLYVASRRKP